MGRILVYSDDPNYGLTGYDSAIFGGTLTIGGHGGAPYGLLPVNGQNYEWNSWDTWSNVDAIGNRPGVSAEEMLALPDTSIPATWSATRWANLQGMSWTTNPPGCPDYPKVRQGTYSLTGAGGPMIFYTYAGLAWQGWWWTCPAPFSTQFSWTSDPLI